MTETHKWLAHSHSLIFHFPRPFQSTPCKHPVILLQDVNFLDLHSLVEFIYHGEVNVHQKSLQSFLKTAEVLRVSGLTQQQAEETHSVSSYKHATKLIIPIFTNTFHLVSTAISSNTKSGECRQCHTYST